MTAKFLFFIVVTVMFIMMVYVNTMSRDGNGNISMIVLYIFFILVTLYDIGSEEGWRL